jgi:hypothetical protein
LVIHFAIGDPQRPSDAGNSSDTRSLGLALKTLRITARTSAPVQAAVTRAPSVQEAATSPWFARALSVLMRSTQ